MHFCECVNSIISFKSRVDVKLGERRNHPDFVTLPNQQSDPCVSRLQREAGYQNNRKTHNSIYSSVGFLWSPVYQVNYYIQPQVTSPPPSPCQRQERQVGPRLKGKLNTHFSTFSYFHCFIFRNMNS